MLSMYSELSHRQNPLSTRINEYNSISTDNNNRMSYRQKGESFDKKKEEIMHLLKPNEIRLSAKAGSRFFHAIEISVKAGAKRFISAATSVFSF